MSNLRNMAYIGYNLFPRDKNYAVIKPCSLPVVTAQIQANFTASNNEATLLFCNDGSTISIDWGDGVVENNIAGSAGIGINMTAKHVYAAGIETSTISAYIQNCSYLTVTDAYAEINLTTVAIDGLGWGMQASYLFYDNVDVFVLENLPFYDAITVATLGQNILSIDFGTYPYLSKLYAITSNIDTITVALSNTNYLNYVCLRANSLSVASIDTILELLATSGNIGGLCVLNNQTPPAVPSTSGQIAKQTLIDNGWFVLTDQ